MNELITPVAFAATLQKAHSVGKVMYWAHPNRAMTRLRISPTGPALRLDRHSGLADFDAALSMSVAARLVRAQQALFPVARPVPALPLSVAAAAFPTFTDAAIASAQAVYADGAAFETPDAPRNSMGPDLLGMLSTVPPLAIAMRVRVRISDQSNIRVHREQYKSARDAAQRMIEVMAEGRAFAIDAIRLKWAGQAPVWNVLLAQHNGSPCRVPRAAQAIASRFVHPTRFTAQRGHSLLPDAVDPVQHALQRGDRIWGMPSMGRLGVFSEESAVIPCAALSSATAAFASALCGAVSLRSR